MLRWLRWCNLYMSTPLGFSTNYPSVSLLASCCSVMLLHGFERIRNTSDHTRVLKSNQKKNSHIWRILHLTKLCDVRKARVSIFQRQIRNWRRDFALSLRVLSRFGHVFMWIYLFGSVDALTLQLTMVPIDSAHSSDCDEYEEYIMWIIFGSSLSGASWRSHDDFSWWRGPGENCTFL